MPNLKMAPCLWVHPGSENAGYTYAGLLVKTIILISSSA